MIFTTEQIKQFKQLLNRFCRWFNLFDFLRVFVLLSLFRLNWWKRCDGKWHALYPIHMHNVWSQTDDWLPNITNICLVLRYERTQSSGTAEQPPLSAAAAVAANQYCAQHKCRLYFYSLSTKQLLLLASTVMLCVLTAVNGWYGARNELAFTVYAHSDFLLNEYMPLWQTLRTLCSQELNQRLLILWIRLRVYAKSTNTDDSTHTLIHNPYKHAITPFQHWHCKQSVRRVVHAYRAACKRMNTLFWFHMSAMQLTYPSFGIKSGQSAVLY